MFERFMEEPSAEKCGLKDLFFLKKRNVQKVILEDMEGKYKKPWEWLNESVESNATVEVKSTVEGVKMTKKPEEINTGEWVQLGKAAGRSK